MTDNNSNKKGTNMSGQNRINMALHCHVSRHIHAISTPGLHCH